MATREVIIINKLGLHARAAAKFVAMASRYSCTVQLGHSLESLVNGKNIMAVMMLAASQGTALHLHTEGEQEQDALEALTSLIEDYFEEGE